ncbi:hypothetical protein [Enterococcus sp. BWR-S5]|uniref:hypothetical protein n=1 Tax=Enterococcus sp. BWR-S5 TaxID=2787714 RepID=UPI0019224163|nr:hypothetical protein [Enterococcus sp. BWR-S5]MBL1225429.1 hypothetical protein [Enterococcus sp. BWR-S5]
MGNLQEKTAMDNQLYLETVDYYLGKITDILETGSREEIEGLAYEESFAAIACTPYFLEQVYCLIQLEYKKVTMHVIEGFRNVYVKQMKTFNDAVFSQKQLVLILTQLEKYLSADEEDYYYFLVKDREGAVKCKAWQEEVLFNHERLAMFQTDLFQTLDNYFANSPNGYESLFVLLKHDPDLSRYLEDDTISVWIHNVLLMGNRNGFVLERLAAQQIYGVLKLHEVTKEEFFCRRLLPEMLKKAQKKTLWKKWRLWSWKRRLSLASH